MSIIKKRNFHMTINDHNKKSDFVLMIRTSQQGFEKYFRLINVFLSIHRQTAFKLLHVVSYFTINRKVTSKNI